MNALAEILPQAAAVDPGVPGTAEANTRMTWGDVPAKMAVYLLLDASDGPLLLATVGDLRAALKRRLTDTPAENRSKRVQYGQLCARVLFRIVHSPFAANWHYYRTARLLFPDAYRDMISWRPTHFIAIKPAQRFPRFQRTETLDEPGMTYVGPIAERRAADKLIETLEDLFDLCRYYHILVQAPHGKACAYKEMGKCPAPCDGTVLMEHYRGQIAEAVAFLDAPDDAVNPRVGYARWRATQESAMRTAASQLAFETASKLKARLGRAALIEQLPFARMDVLSRFAYLALQPGQGKPYVEPFFIRAGAGDDGSCIAVGTPVKRKGLPKAAEAWYLRARELATKPVFSPLSVEQAEEISLVAHHLFRDSDETGRGDAGIYLPIHYLTGPDMIVKAATELLDRKSPPKPMPEQSSDRKVEEPAGTTDTGAAPC